MEIRVKKALLNSLTEFLMDIKLEGRVSRARMKLIFAMSEAAEELQSDSKFIRKENKEDSNKAKKEIDELLEEEAVLDLTKYKELIYDLHVALENIDEKMAFPQSYLHDELLNAIEENMNEIGDDE